MEGVQQLMREAIHFVQEDSYDLAEEAYALALEKSSLELGENDRTTVSILGHLGRVCLCQGSDDKIDLATSLLQRQLFAYEKTPQLQTLLPER